MEANGSELVQDGNNNVPQQPKEWTHLLEELKHVDEYVKEIQQVIKDDRYANLRTLKEAYNQNAAAAAASSFADNQEMIQQNQDLSVQLEDIKEKLRSVNNKYSFAGGKSGETFGFGGSNYDSESSYLTPVSKLPKSATAASGDEDRASSGTVFHSVAGFDSIIPRKKEVPQTSSSSSSDSEPDSDRFVDKHLLQKPNGEEEVKGSNNPAETDVTKEVMNSTNNNLTAQDHESMLQKMKQVLYEKFVERVSEYEKQLKAANEEIENSQEEISRLEQKLTVGIDEVTRNMQTRLDSAHERVRVLEGELDSEKGVVRNLQEKISRLEREVGNRDCEIGELNLTLNDARESFKREKSRFDAEILELTQKLGCSVKKLNRDCEIGELNLTLNDARKSFKREKSRFDAEILELTQKLDCSVKKLEQSESKVRSLEDQIQELETRMDRDRECYEAQQRGYLTEIDGLKQGMSERGEEVEKLNKEFDAKKLDYDMLRAEKDEQAAKMEKLGAELNDQGIQMKQMEDRISELERERAGLVACSEEKGRAEQELRVRVDELRQEIDQQSAALSDRAEEKREAIRQLCFSLDYYRHEYLELCRVFPRKKRQQRQLAS